MPNTSRNHTDVVLKTKNNSTIVSRKAKTPRKSINKSPNKSKNKTKTKKNGKSSA